MQKWEEEKDPTNPGAESHGEVKEHVVECSCIKESGERLWEFSLERRTWRLAFKHGAVPDEVLVRMAPVELELWNASVGHCSVSSMSGEHEDKGWQGKVTFACSVTRKTP